MWYLKKRKERTYSTYPGFPHHSGEVSAYLADLQYFIIALSDGRVVRYQPENTSEFHEWLVNNQVRDINAKV